ncbi:MAG TPA: pyridoxamine 5'-phosphate oxidase family protein [Micromonosporaceae bacterium]|jgi:general stress protein 26
MDGRNNDEEIRKVADLINGNRIGMLTTIAPDGTLMSRPMALQDVEFDADLWLYAERNSRKVNHIGLNPQVNVTVGSGSDWVSLSGTMAVVDDPGKKKDLWNAGVAAWFPDGPDSDDLVLLRIASESAEYWDTPGGRVASIVSFAKARVTGQRYSGGENETVDL